MFRLAGVNEVDPALLIVLVVFFVPGVVAFRLAKMRIRGGVESLFLGICMVPIILLLKVDLGSVTEFYRIVVSGAGVIALTGAAAGACAGWCETPE